MKFILKITLFILFLSLFNISFAQKKQRLLRDTLDNAFDVSHYMYDLNGLLPILSPITEPAVGFGGALAMVYFIPKKKDSTLKFQMPDILAIAGGLTENNTWFLGGGYLGFWKNDHIRYRGIFGYGDIKLKYYGNGSDFLAKNPISFSTKSTFLLQQANFRIGNSNFLLGGKYQYSKTTNTLFEENDSKWINPKELKMTNSAIGIIGEFENFNNFISPTKGIRFNINYLQYSQLIGSDQDFGISASFLHYYLPIIQNKWISGFRLEGQLATENTPFYLNPFINLRGVPAMRYQGKLTALVETEQLLLLTKRWGIVAFTGIGSTYENNEQLNKTATTWNYGTGFRYLIARELGLRMGIDVAKSNNDWGVYIIFGTAWLK